jgi:hypothetical protein
MAKVGQRHHEHQLHQWVGKNSPRSFSVAKTHNSFLLETVKAAIIYITIRVSKQKTLDRYAPWLAMEHYFVLNCAYNI